MKESRPVPPAAQDKTVATNGASEKNLMRIDVRMTVEELELLTSLASDQLFRREFIDPKMPGHRTNAAQLVLGKSIVARLHALHPKMTKPAQLKATTTGKFR